MHCLPIPQQKSASRGPKSLGTIPAEFQGLVWGKTALLCTTRFNVWSPQKKEWMNSGTKCLKKRAVGHRRIFPQPPVCSYPWEWQTSDVQLLDPQCQKALTVPHCWHRKKHNFLLFLHHQNDICERNATTSEATLGWGQPHPASWDVERTKKSEAFFCLFFTTTARFYILKCFLFCGFFYPFLQQLSAHAEFYVCPQWPISSVNYHMWSPAPCTGSSIVCWELTKVYGRNPLPLMEGWAHFPFHVPPRTAPLVAEMQILTTNQTEEPPRTVMHMWCMRKRQLLHWSWLLGCQHFCCSVPCIQFCFAFCVCRAGFCTPWAPPSGLPVHCQHWTKGRES